MSRVRRGFGAAQWDFGVHRSFPIREAWHLDFRGEFFNVLNHPNFGNPVSDMTSPAADVISGVSPTNQPRIIRAY